MVCDAAEFPIPDDLTIGYLFAPFENRTLGAVLQNIVDSVDRHPRTVHLIYVCPNQARLLLDTGRFRLVKELRGGLHDARISRAAIFESC